MRWTSWNALQSGHFRPYYALDYEEAQYVVWRLHDLGYNAWLDGSIVVHNGDAYHIEIVLDRRNK